MKDTQYLWDILNVNRNSNTKQIDLAYKAIKNKTDKTKLAWKILRDEYYRNVYKKHLDIDMVYQAGFILDSLEIEDMDYYNLNWLSTPVSKIAKNIEDIENPVVLLTTGGFNPIHKGHIQMMELAKKELERKGYNVIGGYISLTHESYVSTKPYYTVNEYERLSACRESVKDNNWIMVDPWESLYVKTYINFTDVIKRLELYLQKHIDKNIKVAYVCGGDNVEFMYCFEEQGIGVCVDRYGYNQKFEDVKNEVKSAYAIFVDNNLEEATYASRDLRKKQLANKTGNTVNGSYLIRNEDILPLLIYKNKSTDVLKMNQRNFLRKFVDILNNVFEHKIDIEVIDIMHQLNDTYAKFEDKKTISLDTYYKGTYNLQLSRLFNISDYQNKNLSLVGRLGNASVKEQISNIEAGNYILVDDDSVSGRTIKEVKENLPPEIKIEEIYLMSSVLKKNVYDIIDLRDFLVGSENSGLVVELPNGDIARAPYIMPYVSLETRASIPVSKEREFSIAVWKLNKRFYQMLDKDLKLGDTDYGFRMLMNYVGFDNNTLITDICDWHLKNLK